jgi:secreted PhoX family phosphatase
MNENTLQARREFLKFFGRTSLICGTATSGFAWDAFAGKTEKSLPKFLPLVPQRIDSLRLVEGLQFELLLKQGEQFGSSAIFGDCNDFLHFTKLESKENEGILWVNHEDAVPLFISGYQTGEKTKAQVDAEMAAVGGSLVHIRQQKSGKWEVVKDSQYNRRIDANTPIPFAAGVSVSGQTTVLGTCFNCAGGSTPWGTVLSCEENTHVAYGDPFRTPKGKYRVDLKRAEVQWVRQYDRRPEHYGWVLEIDPKTGVAKKHTSMGRFAHEGATVVKATDGRCVVYLGDDANDQYIYKFIAAKEGSLDEGELFVADTVAGRWLSLDLRKQKKLQAKFTSQLEVMIFTREAATLLGATPHNRPEDIEQDPVTKAMFISCTNNAGKGDQHGSILRIDETGQNPLSLTFTCSVFLVGGAASGLSCPDNMIFDRSGNLWVTSDIPGSKAATPEYAPYGNNGLYLIPMQGKDAGKPLLVATAPNDAEFTGPCFSPDYKQLFLSVQHPGETSPNLQSLTSHWPDGGEAKPRSSVVVLSGSLLEKITAGS